METSIANRSKAHIKIEKNNVPIVIARSVGLNPYFQSTTIVEANIIEPIIPITNMIYAIIFTVFSAMVKLLVLFTMEEHSSQ